MISQTTNAWEKFETALKERVPHYLDALGEGATSENLDRLQELVEFTIPEEVRQFFLRHNVEYGVQDPAKRNTKLRSLLPPLFSDTRLLPVAESGGNNILAQWRFNKDCSTRAKDAKADHYEGPVKQVVRHSKWIPFATDINGNGLYFDLDPAEGGQVGQVIECDYDQSRIAVLFPSPAALLEARAEHFLSSKDQPGVVDPKSEVAKAWNALTEALAHGNPRGLADLNPPVTWGDLELFEAKTRLKLPQDIKDFFLVHDGQGSDDSTEDLEEEDMIFSHFLMPLAGPMVESCLGEYFRRQDSSFDPESLEVTGPAKSLSHSDKWIPFATDFSGNFLSFDLDPEEGGKVGQVLELDYEMSTIKVVASSVSEFLLERVSEFASRKAKVTKKRNRLRVPAEPSPGSEVAEAYRALEEAVRRHSRRQLETFNPPVPQDDIATAEKLFGFELPQDLRDFFAVHNGQDPQLGTRGPTFYFGYFFPLIAARLSGVTSYWEMIHQVERGGKPDPLGLTAEGNMKTDKYPRGWIPLAHLDGIRINIIYDLDPASDGAVGQIIELDWKQGSARVIAKSLTEFLGQLTEQLKNPKPVERKEAVAAPAPTKATHEVVVKADNIIGRAPNAVLVTSTLRALGIEIRLETSELLKEALEAARAESSYIEDTKVVAGKVVAFTIRVSGKPQKILVESLDGFAVKGNLMADGKMFGSGLKQVFSKEASGGARPIFYFTAPEMLSERVSLFVEIQSEQSWV